MRSIQISDAKELFADLLHDAEHGETLTIMRGDRPIANIIPFPHPSGEAVDEDRREAIAQLEIFLKQGIDMGGYKIVNRDELYDRG